MTRLIFSIRSSLRMGVGFMRRLISAVGLNMAVAGGPASSDRPMEDRRQILRWHLTDLRDEVLVDGHPLEATLVTLDDVTVGRQSCRDHAHLGLLAK